MNYQLLQEKLAIAHGEIERLLERLLEEPLSPLPAIGVNEPWHREYLRVKRIVDALERLESLRAAAHDASAPARESSARTQRRRANA
jgi:hypothetical protein